MHYRGVDLPRNKRMEIALTYIYGIGRRRRSASVPPRGRPGRKSRSDRRRGHRIVVNRHEPEVEGDLRREWTQNIKRLVDLAAIAAATRRNLPVRASGPTQRPDAQGTSEDRAGKKMAPSK